MSILRRKRPFLPDEEEVAPAAAAAASASEEDELASSPARRTRSLSRRDRNGNPNGDGGMEGGRFAGNPNCKGVGREGRLVGNPNCKGGVGENPNCKGKREEKPVRNPNCEGKPVGNPNCEGKPVCNTNCEGKSVGNPNCEGKPVGNPNSEGKLVGNPNCEGKPVGNPNCKGKREEKPVENQAEGEEEPVENQGKTEGKPVENPNCKGKSEEKPAENPNSKGKRGAKPVENPNSKGNREGKPAENPDCEGKWEGKPVENPNCEGKREKKPAGNSNCKGGGGSGSGSDIETLSDWVQQCIKMEKQKKKKRRLEDLDGNIQKTCGLLYSRKVQRLPRTTTAAASAAFHDESQQTMDFICKMEGLNLHVNLLGLECAQENSVGYGGSLQNSIGNGESLQNNSVGHGRSLRNSVLNGGSVQKNSVENGESLQKNSVGDGRSLRNSVRNGGSVQKNSVESGDTLQKNFFRDGRSLQNSVQKGGSMQKNSVENGESLQKNSIGNDGSLQKNSVSNGRFLQKSSFRNGGILLNSVRNRESLRKNSVGNGRYLQKNSVRNEESLHKNSIKNGEFSQKNSVENGGSLQIYSVRNAESLQKSSVGNGPSFGVTTRFKNRESEAVNQTGRSSLGMSVCIESIEPQADDPMKDSCSEFLVDCGLPHTNGSLQASPHANSVLACPQEEEGKEEEEEERIKSIAKSLQLGKMLIPEGKSDLTKSQDVEAVAKEAEERLKLMDGRRCGLCGGGSNGELPERLASIKHKEGGGQANKVGKSQASSRSFVMEPGWLGRLLGPLDDRFGIAGVWVHQECAIWTPEVYFSGIGHMRNVRAALRRGRRLRCSRCGRRGATIGCRVDKCTRTYHLPCGYFEGGLFDHKKYLMACAEHAFMFLPRSSRRGSSEKGLVHSKIQYQSMVAERKKEAQKALLRDAEAEEKWMENAGVDEEFVRRESKRLRRNLQMLAPVFVGRNEGGRNISSGWETVAGLQSVVQCLKEMVILPLLYPEAFNKLGISAPRGVLLHGSPGTGKTHIVKALVGACAKGGERIAYFSRKGADCLGKYVGDAERQLRLLFHLAERHQPAIIFFDEIDGLAPKRSHHHHDQTQKSVVSTLLALMDGLCPRGAVVVIGATNRPDDLDPALRRPGRFDREVHFPLPSLCDRAAILALRTKKWETPPPKEVLYFLAKGTPGYAGADLQALCAEAAMVAIRRVVPPLNLLHNEILPPSLPALSVRVSDWVAALKQAPTPCSYRLGKGAAYEDLNPLPRYMVPLLIKPMAELLISLYLDPRVMLPPPLESSTKLIHGLLSSTTEGYQIGGHWKHKLQLQVMSSSKALEDALSTNGMLFGKDTDFRKHSENEQDSSYAGSSFRMMLSGDRMNGQSLFAPWILYGFSGYAEILKLSLAAMLQEGCGDAIQGLLKLLGEVKLTRPCVLYLPQIESWAVEIAELDNGQMEQIASQSWNLFVQQMSLMPVDIPIIILASCELQKGNLPIEISKFFGEDLPDIRVSINTPSLYCAPVPSIWVEMGTFVDTPAIFERAAEHYAFFFSQRFLCAARSFSRSSKDLSQQCLYRNGLYSKEESFGALGGKNPENKEDKALHEVTFRTDIDGSSMSRPSDVSVAISNCGLQLIFHPELAELRHATLRLKESPHACSRKNKKKLRFLWGDGHGDSTGKVVTGLAAVGLLAHNGLYLTAMELALEVRKVLDLLKRAVSVKVQRGKDQFLYFRILSQAAALDDKMFAWAHHLQRWEMNLGKFHRDEGRALDSIRGSGQQIDEASSGSELRLEANFKAFSGEGRSNKDDDHLLPKTLHLSDSRNSNEGKIKDIANSNTALKFKRSSQSSSQVCSQIRNVKFNAAKDLFPKLWKCCPQCEDEIVYTLKDAFQALLGRGKFRKSSADDIHDVIGICVAAVSKALSRLLCTLNQTKGALNEDESPTTGHICLAGASCGRKNKCAIRMSEMTVEAKHVTVFLCLCPLLKAISNMLCFLEC